MAFHAHHLVFNPLGARNFAFSSWCSVAVTEYINSIETSLTSWMDLKRILSRIFSIKRHLSIKNEAFCMNSTPPRLKTVYHGVQKSPVRVVTR